MKKSVKTELMSKQEAFRSLFEILDIEWQNAYISGGGTVTKQGLNALLNEVAIRNGIPPQGNFKKIRLVNKSLEACTLALEMIKRANILYRTESFLTLFTNAWELLLKAKILNDGGDIMKSGEKDKTISMKDAYRIVFLSRTDPIRLNLKELSDLRNSATHSFIQFAPFSMIPILQAGVSNFVELVQNWFNIDIRYRIPEGSLILLVDKEYQIKRGKKVISLLPRYTIEFINKWEKRIKETIQGMNESDIIKYYYPIDFPISKSSTIKKSDALSYFGAFEKSNGEQLSVLL